MATKILTKQQINYIYKQVSKAFAEGTDKKLTINIKEFQKQINSIYSHLKLEETFHTSGKHKGYKLINLSPRKQALAMKGYILIFKFRQFLLDEEINYRYYYQSKDGIYVNEFTEDDIANFVKFNETGIQINPSAAKISPGEISSIYQSYIGQYFKTYTSGEENDYMKRAKESPFRVVRSRIMSKYEFMNSGLRKKDGRYQVFSEGHIYEALDTSLSLACINEEVSDEDKLKIAMEVYTFGRFLAYDHIKASQGGDNAFTNTSIKSNVADLYDYYTIVKQLGQIKEILNNGLENKEMIANFIEKEYLHKDKVGEEKLHQIVGTAVDKFMKEMEESLKKSLT